MRSSTATTIWANSLCSSAMHVCEAIRFSVCLSGPLMSTNRSARQDATCPPELASLITRDGCGYATTSAQNPSIQ
jgi:hypothetical protein